MKQLIFFVQGSSAVPYCVTFELLDGNNMNANCTCRAGQVGQYCKHRFGLLKGSSENLVSENAELIPEVLEMLRGSDIEAAMKALVRAEMDYVEAQRQVRLTNEEWMERYLESHRKPSEAPIKKAQMAEERARLAMNSAKKAVALAMRF